MKHQILRRSAAILILVVCSAVAGLCQTNESPTTNLSAKTFAGRFNERFVYNTLRQIHSAQITYQAAIGNGNFAVDFRELAVNDLISQNSAAGDIYGYFLVMTVTPPTAGTPASFTVTATPRRYEKGGRLSYFLDATGEIRGADKYGRDATASDPVIVMCGNNETEAIQTLRTLHGGEITYQSTVGLGNFGTLANLFSNGLINSSIAAGGRCGYNFTVTTTNDSANVPLGFQITAVPQQYPATGQRSFYTDESGVIRGADRAGQFADANDSPVQE